MPEPTTSSAWDRLLTVGAVASVVVGVVARFVTTSPLWLDEALSVNVAELPLGQIDDALRQDGHPPLYYWLLHWWIEVFGSGDGAVRALSGVFSLVVVALAVMVARDLTAGQDPADRRRVALAVAAVVAVTPYCVRYATEARMYSLEMAEVLAGWLLVRRATRRRSWPLLTGVALVTGALCLTHYWALYLVAATGALLVWRLWRSPGDRPRIGPVAAAMAVGTLAFVPWSGVFFDQLAHTGTPWAPPARPTVVVADTVTELGGFSADATVFGVVVTLAALAGVFLRRRGEVLEVDLGGRPEVRREAIVVVATLVLACVAMLVSRSAFATRYAAVVIPMILVLAGLGIGSLGTARRVTLALGAVVVLAGPGVAYNIRTDRTQGGDVVEQINAAAAPGDLVAYCPDQIGPAYSRGLRADVDRVRYPDLGDPARVDWRDYEERNAAADPVAFAAALLDRAQGHTIWLAYSTGYRTLEGKCEAVFNALAVVRPPTPIIGPNSGVFEPGALASFPP